MISFGLSYFPVLQHVGRRPDRVIDTLLEGSLPPELALLPIINHLA